MSKKYSGYKAGYNCKGIPKGRDEQEYPDNPSTSCKNDESFVQACKNATDNINKLIEEGRLPASFWNTSGGTHKGKLRESKVRGSSPKYQEVIPSPRQYRRWMNGHGLAHQYKTLV
jgi:hypothetical protein